MLVPIRTGGRDASNFVATTDASCIRFRMLDSFIVPELSPWPEKSAPPPIQWTPV